MTNKVIGNCLPIKEILPESAYLSGDPSGIARGFGGSAFPSAYLAPLGWTAIFSIFTGIGAFNRGKAIALQAEKCQDLTSKMMGQVQSARGITEVLCGLLFIPLRFSQTVKQLKMVYFKPLYLAAMSVVLVLYALLAIPLAYRVYLYCKIRKEVAGLSPADRLEFYQNRLLTKPVSKVKIECEGETLEMDVKDLHPEKTIAIHIQRRPHSTFDNSLESHELEPRVKPVLEEFTRFKKAYDEHPMQKMRMEAAFGFDAVQLIQGKGSLKEIDWSKNLYIFMLSLGVITAVIGIGVFAYSMKMDGLAIIQNYGLMAVSGVFLVCDLYGFILNLKHSPLDKEKVLTLAVTALVFAAALVTFLHHGHATLMSQGIFYGVLSGWALQMIVLFGAALYKKRHAQQLCLPS